MTTIYATGSKTDICPECGGAATYTTYGGNVTVWTGDYDERGSQEQRTESLSEGFAVECGDCGFADGEPPQY